MKLECSMLRGKEAAAVCLEGSFMFGKKKTNRKNRKNDDIYNKIIGPICRKQLWAVSGLLHFHY